ncbi:MAG: hypothetical protein ACI4K9_02755 [Candidatus Fimenecus sp.]
MRFEYFCFPETNALPDGTVFSTYAVQCVRRSQRYTVPIARFHDVSVDLAFTERLCKLCTEAQIEPCHFLDIFYDLSL